MPNEKNATGKAIAELDDEPKLLIGRAILNRLTAGNFTFTNPIATEGGDYDQSEGPYTQSGGGTHNQGSGGYDQSKLTDHLGHLDITDLADILGSVGKFDR